MKIKILRDLPRRLAVSLRLARLKANIFETLIATMAVLTSLEFLFHPTGLQRTSIGQVLHEVALIWMIMYGLAGVTVLIGLLRYRIDIEIAGLFLLTGGVLINLVSIISVYGIVDRVPSIGVYAATVLACLARINMLYRGDDIFLLKVDDEKNIAVADDNVVDILKDDVLKKAVLTEDILKEDDR